MIYILIFAHYYYLHISPYIFKISLKYSLTFISII